MKFNNILWVDDNPKLEYFPIYYSKSQREQFARSFLERTTLAFDLEMAQEECAKRNYDLYILDADFPQKMKDERRKYLAQHLKRLRRNPTTSRDFQFMPSWDADAISGSYFPGCGNEFRFLWKKCLQGKQNAVVFSISRDAPVYACQIGWPFFFKSSDSFNSAEVKKEIKEKKGHIAGQFPSDEQIQKWTASCGSAQRLVDEYLL